MIQWALSHIGWFLIRIGVTLMCILTVQNVVAREGYRIEFFDLVIYTVCLIIVTRFWMPKSYEKESKKETSWNG